MALFGLPRGKLGPGHLESRIPDDQIFDITFAFDVVGILLLLGESTIWAAIWSRHRFQQRHWSHFIFPASLGWAPLAGTVFARMQGSRGPPNLIFDHMPEGQRTKGLMLTNLNSGATHEADHVILQNIWQTWYRGPRRKHQRALGKSYDTTRETAVVDVEVSKIEPGYTWLFLGQAGCLVLQLSVGLAVGLTQYSFETLISLGVTLSGQLMLLYAISPSAKAWNGRDLTVHRPVPVMLHRGLNSSAVLLIRSSKINGLGFSLEEYTFEPQAVRDTNDEWKMVASGCAFIMFVLQVILAQWMHPVSKLVYFSLNFLGLFMNALEGSFQPRWDAIYDRAFEGRPVCEPRSSTLMGAVGLLVAGKFPSYPSAARNLYPDNERFANSLARIHEIVDEIICEACRARFSSSQAAQPCSKSAGELTCSAAMRQAVCRRGDGEIREKHSKDAVATCVHFLEWATAAGDQPPLTTTGPFDLYQWKPPSQKVLKGGASG